MDCLLHDLKCIVLEYATPLSDKAKSLLDKKEIHLAEEMLQKALKDSSEPNMDEVIYNLAMIYAFDEKHRHVNRAKHLLSYGGSTSYKCSSLKYQLEWKADTMTFFIPTEDVSDGGYLRFMQCVTNRMGNSLSIMFNQEFGRYLTEREKIKALACAHDVRAIDLVSKFAPIMR